MPIARGWHCLQVREAACALSAAALSWTGVAPPAGHQEQQRLPSPRIRGRRAERARSLAAAIGLHVRQEDVPAANTGAGPASDGVLAVALPWASAAGPDAGGEHP